MTRIQNIIAYLYVHFLYKERLSKARLTNLVYLADWTSALVDGKQLTSIKWKFNHLGPHDAEDGIENICENDNFEFISTKIEHFNDRITIRYKGEPELIDLSERDKLILESVINKTQDMFYKELVDYVYSSYPIIADRRYYNLDLVALAKECKNLARQDIKKQKR